MTEHDESVSKWFSEDKITKTWTSESTFEEARLVMDLFTTKPGAWEFVRARVFTGTEMKHVATVWFNYHDFPHLWRPGYLICCQDYQGHGWVRLSDGHKEFMDHNKLGNGFCWANIDPGTQPNTIKVHGCVWAGPYETIIYDITNIEQVPYPILERIDDEYEPEDDDEEGDE